MFNKKCSRCARKISKEFEFCPYCGFNIKKENNEKNYGFLGKDDNMGFPDFQMPFGFNNLFNSLLKQIDKQFQSLDKEIGKEYKEERIKVKPVLSRGISISISSCNGKKPEVKVRGFGPSYENLIQQAEQSKEVKIKPQIISEETARKFAKFPRKEAETNVRRMSNKIIYEISLPGVSSLKEIILNKLENSIEIKAFSKDKVYVKLLPVKLPILGYKLEDEKLILELKAG